MNTVVKYKVTLGKNRYHQQPIMENWCRENLGPGKWLYGTPETWEGLDNINWSIDSMFGNTTFAFKDPKHFSMFVLRWS